MLKNIATCTWRNGAKTAGPTQPDQDANLQPKSDNKLQHKHDNLNKHALGKYTAVQKWWWGLEWFACTFIINAFIYKHTAGWYEVKLQFVNGDGGSMLWVLKDDAACFSALHDFLEGVVCVMTTLGGHMRDGNGAHHGIHITQCPKSFKSNKLLTTPCKSNNLHTCLIHIPLTSPP